MPKSAKSDNPVLIDENQIKEKTFNVPDMEELDLFSIKTGYEIIAKDDIFTMMFPFFSLSKKRDLTIRNWKNGNTSLSIFPSALGAPTIFDKDLLIFVQTKLSREYDATNEVSRRIKFNVAEFFSFVGKNKPGGNDYKQILDAIRRLNGVRFETSLSYDGTTTVDGRGFIEDYKVGKYTSNGEGAIEVEILLSNWLYQATIHHKLLSAPTKEYFAIDKPMEKRMYELARVHCGNNKPYFKIGLELFQGKCGSSSTLRLFRQRLKKIAAEDNIPDYSFWLDESRNRDQFLYIFPKDQNMRKNALSKDAVFRHIYAEFLKTRQKSLLDTKQT
jgi:plasmid replication initiation protein